MIGRHPDTLDLLRVREVAKMERVALLASQSRLELKQLLAGDRILRIIHDEARDDEVARRTLGGSTISRLIDVDASHDTPRNPAETKEDGPKSP